jgi:hypothetical protein
VVVEGHPLAGLAVYEVDYVELRGVIEEAVGLGVEDNQGSLLAGIGGDLPSRVNVFPPPRANRVRRLYPHGIGQFAFVDMQATAAVEAEQRIITTRLCRVVWVLH